MTRLSVAAGSLWAIVLVAPLLWVINVGVRVWLPVFFLIFAGVRAKRAPSTFLYFGPLLADSLLLASSSRMIGRPTIAVAPESHSLHPTAICSALACPTVCRQDCRRPHGLYFSCCLQGVTSQATDPASIPLGQRGHCPIASERCEAIQDASAVEGFGRCHRHSRPIRFRLRQLNAR
jgi:hypothetical protein